VLRPDFPRLQPAESRQPVAEAASVPRHDYLTAFGEERRDAVDGGKRRRRDVGVANFSVSVPTSRFRPRSLVWDGSSTSPTRRNSSAERVNQPTVSKLRAKP